MNGDVHLAVALRGNLVLIEIAFNHLDKNPNLL